MILSNDALESLLSARYRELDDAPGVGFEAIEGLALQLSRADVDGESRRELLVEPGLAELLLDFAASAPPAVPHRPRWVRPTLATLALAAAVLFALWRPAHLLQSDAGRSTLTPKGAMLAHGDAVAVAVERDGRTWRARSGEALATGDDIGVFYSTERESWLLVAHVDAAGDVTWLAPSDGASAAQQPPGRDVPLPTGARLIEATGCQWFVAVFSDDAIEPTAAAEALQAAAQRSVGCDLDVDLPEARSVRVLGIRR